MWTKGEESEEKLLEKSFRTADSSAISTKSKGSRNEPRESLLNGHHSQCSEYPEL